MKLRLAALALAIASLARAERLPPPSSFAAPTIELGNGLAIVVAPDPAASSVVVHVRYHGGAAGETAAEAGYTHLVERLLFAGSVHVKPGDHDARIDAAGGFTGSTTGADHLSVYEQVPPGALELALWLEAERMAGLADGITEAGLAAAQAPIAQEYTSAYVDQPYALVSREVQRALWPAGHRYRNDVLGDGAAVPGATLDRVRAFVRARIRPGNATLVIAGRVDAAAATALARRYFGWIPDKPHRAAAGEEVAPMTARATVTVDDPVPKVVVAYRLPDPHASDFLALEVVVRLLAGSRSSALNHSLVETDLASDVHAELVRHATAGELHITVTPKRGTARSLAERVQRDIDALARQPLAAADLERAVAAFETDLLIALEGIVYRADALARWQDHDRQWLFDSLPDRLHALSPQLVQRVAAKWLASSASAVVIGERDPR